MIRAIIIDDEEYIRTSIIDFLKEGYGEKISVVAEATNVLESLLKIDEFQPDLLFLDVNLEDGTGFDVLQKCQLDKLNVIFVTGFDQHAIKAIKVGALDYILKPIDPLELHEAVTKALENQNKEGHLKKLIEISSEYFNGVMNKRVILKTSDNVYAVYEDDIVYCKSDGNYTTIYTQQLEKIMISKPIKKVQEILSEEIFVRCHQSYVVNKKHVVKYNKQGILILNVDIKIPVSSRRKDYTLKRIFD